MLHEEGAQIQIQIQIHSQIDTDITRVTVTDLRNTVTPHGLTLTLTRAH